MRKLMTVGTLSLAGAVTTGLIAFQAPGAFADDDPAYKRDDDGGNVVVTVDDDDDDDTAGSTRTRTRTRGTNASRNGDHSRGNGVRDLTSDGPGSGNLDRSRHHTNDGTRHDTR